MISFFALSLSCLNAGARIIYPMARHSVFPARLGTARCTPPTRPPAAALSAYILVMFAVPAIWSTQTDVLTVFNDKFSPDSATCRRAEHAALVADSDALSPVYTAVSGDLRTVMK